MLRFLYWAVKKETQEEVNFIDENLYEVGSEILINDTLVTIVDIAVEDNISCEECYLQQEDMRYGYCY